MNNLIMNFNVLAPMILMVVLGKVLSVKRLINSNYIDISSKIVFKIALPITLFLSTSKINLSNGIDSGTINLILYGSAVMILAFPIAAYVAKLLSVDNKVKGAFIQGTCRSNFAIIGYPVLLSIFGDEVVFPMSLFTICLIGITNGLSVIALTMFDSENKRINKLTLFRNIAFNPLIDSLIIGFVFSYFELRMPAFINSTLSQISGLTTPLALINIGAIFNLSIGNEKIKTLYVSVIVKSIIIPLIAVIIAIYLGFRGTALGIIFIALVSPAPPSSFVMAKIMNSDGKLAANIVVASTIASAFVIFIGITMMQYYSLL
jgi:predicted permease